MESPATTSFFFRDIRLQSHLLPIGLLILSSNYLVIMASKKPSPRDTLTPAEIRKLRQLLADQERQAELADLSIPDQYSTRKSLSVSTPLFFHHLLPNVVKKMRSDKRIPAEERPRNVSDLVTSVLEDYLKKQHGDLWANWPDWIGEE